MGNELTKKSAAPVYIHSIIGIAIMVFFQYIPAPAPITPLGMFILGVMIGMIYLWTFVDMVWPAFVGIVFFGLRALEVYPSSWQNAGIYEAGMEAFGHWIALFALGCMILAVALQKTGVVRRITMWFITRKIAKKSPYAFSFMFLLATLVVSAFLDCVVAQFLMLSIAHEIFDELGFKKGDAWPRYMVTATTFTVIISFAMTPICHSAPLLFMAVYSGITGVTANFITYMAVGLPIGIIVFLLEMVWFRFFVKIDMEQFKNIDFEVMESKRPGKMDTAEKVVSTVSLIVVAWWLVHGFLGVWGSGTALYGLMEKLTDTTPLFLAIALLAIVHVSGKPILNLRQDLAKVDWGTYLFLASMMMIAGSMGEGTTGIGAFVAAKIVPLVSGMNPYLVVTLIAVLGCLITNFFNNIPCGIIFTSVGVPMALEMGINPYIVCVAICIGCNLAFTIPPAFVPVGIAYADPYCKGTTVLKNGLAMTVICVIVLAALTYPLGLLFIH